MEESPSIYRAAIKWGVILGVVSLIISLLIYIIDPTLFVKWWLGLLLFAISLVIVIYGGVEFRKEVGGYLPFGSSWIFSMVAFIIGGFINILFGILLYNFIDPGVTEIIVEASIENAEAMAESFGASGDALDEAMEDARDRTVESFTPIGQIKNFFIAWIFYAIFSLISAAIIKRKEPETL